MSCTCFNKTLQYVSPAHGGWGVVRIAALVPESYQLFVAPFACGRHGALGGIINGIKNRISYLYIDEADIVSGNYEKLIPDAVNELFDFIKILPKVLFIFVSCLDDLLGTDHESIIAVLSKNYPQVQFRTCHMNPIQMDTKLPPGVSLQNNIYSLLSRNEEKQNQINLIGNNDVLLADTELFSLLADRNYRLCHISDFREFKDFLCMSKSKLNLILSPTALNAANNMLQNLAIPFEKAYPSYNPDEVYNFYQNLAQCLHIEAFDIKIMHKEAVKAIKKTAFAAGDYPIAIDYQAVRKPFTLAKTLLEYGFNVCLIASDSVPAFEKESFDWLQTYYPNIELVNPLCHDAVKFSYKTKQYLCIGLVCAYMTESSKVINILEDEGLFGYSGIVSLMRMMRRALNLNADVNKMIQEAGLII